jgi:predicted Zn-ribbon and HTH transcriptional regulator
MNATTARANADEQPNFIYFECSECGFSSVQKSDFKGSSECPLCAGDSGHSVSMSRRVARESDKPEGRDARKQRDEET